MIRERDKVKCRNGREGVVVALLEWKDGKPNAAAVRHNDNPVYPNEEVVYQLRNLLPA